MQLSGGIDFPSAFYFRGYEQADRGPIVQPYLNVFTARAVGDDLVVRPYVSLFHSRHWDSNSHMADMSDVMLGALTSAGGFAVDVRYGYYTMNPMRRSEVHELGARASVDVVTCWRDCAEPGPFSLRPFVGLYGELSDENGTEDVFLNLGLEPSWQLELAGHKIGVGLPLEWGLSADDYYLDADGSDATFGFFSAALTTSISIPTSERCGRWFLNTSVQYLHLAADSVRAMSGGERDVCLGKIGLSFVY